MSEALSASLTPQAGEPTARSISRRQWLVTSGLSAVATAALPGLLPAMPAMPAPLTDYSAHERAVTAARRAAGPIRLCYNENPFGMSPKSKAAITTYWDEHNKYDPPALPELRNTFAKHVGVDPDCVLVTQGSGEVLDIAAAAYGMHGGEIVTARPPYEGLPRYAESIGARVHRVALTGALDQDLEAMDKRTTNNVDLVFFCNPNNPTGVLTDP